MGGLSCKYCHYNINYNDYLFQKVPHIECVLSYKDTFYVQQYVYNTLLYSYYNHASLVLISPHLHMHIITNTNSLTLNWHVL